MPVQRLICDPFERRIAVAKFVGDDALNLIHERIAWWTSRQHLFRMSIKYGAQTCMRFGDRK